MFFICMCATPSGSEGGRLPSVRRWLVFNEATRGYYFVCLLWRQEQRIISLSISFPETTIGITQCIFFGDENKTSLIHKSHSVSHGYYSVRLLRRQFPETSIGITSCVSSGDKNKNIPYQQVPFGLTRLLLHASPSETRAKTFCSLLFITTQTDALPMAMLPMGDNLL